MSNDSTMRGYLQPVGNPLVYDNELKNLLIQWICGITTLNEENVNSGRNVTNQETRADEEMWCIFQIMEFSVTSPPDYIHQEEQSEQWTIETLKIHFHFGGNQGMGTAALFRDGMQVSQNNDELSQSGLKLHECSSITATDNPLFKEQNTSCYELDVYLQRKIIRHYEIKSLVKAPFIFTGE